MRPGTLFGSHQLPRFSLRSDWAWLLALTLATATGATFLAEALVNWSLLDMTAYRAAAMRIREGEVLYGGDVHLNSAYRYAPWFAYAWVPLSHLPEVAIRVVWSTLLVAGAVISLMPLVDRSKASLILLLLFAPLMLGSAAGGNVQPLMVGALVFGLRSRWGWLAVGFAASLKLIPLAFCAVFVAERRWSQAAGAIAVTVLMWAPVLWMTVEPITFETGLGRLLPAPLWLLVPAAAGLAALAFATRRSPLTALAAALGAIVSLPRLFVYELAILLPAVPPRRPRK